jgi:hypothetical protein
MNSHSNKHIASIIKCKIDNLLGLIFSTCMLLLCAIVAANRNQSIHLLFISIALVAMVVLSFIPMIKKELLPYHVFELPGKLSSFSNKIHTIGIITGILAIVSFLIAGIIQVSFLSFVIVWVKESFGVSIEILISYIIYFGILSCVLLDAVLSFMLLIVIKNRLLLKKISITGNSATTPDTNVVLPDKANVLITKQIKVTATHNTSQSKEQLQRKSLCC